VPNQEDSVTPNEEADTSADSTLVVDSGEMMLALSRNRDDESNRQSTPPDGEFVSFRSSTLADVFAGSGVDEAVRCLSALEWAEDAADVSQEVESALLGYKYYRHLFWIREPDRNPVFPGITQAWAHVPDGVDRIYGDVNVLGPSLVVLVLTFVFTESTAATMDRQLRVDGESQLRRQGSRFAIHDARGEKKDRVWAARQDISVVCQNWASTAFPGMLSQVTEGFGRPTCGLVTLALGTPFMTHQQYMANLELVNNHLAYRFVNHEYLFWTTRTVSFNHSREVM
jgi:hypothetical protein